MGVTQWIKGRLFGKKSFEQTPFHGDATQELYMKVFQNRGAYLSSINDVMQDVMMQVATGKYFTYRYASGADNLAVDLRTLGADVRVHESQPIIAFTLEGKVKVFSEAQNKVVSDDKTYPLVELVIAPQQNSTYWLAVHFSQGQLPKDLLKTGIRYEALLAEFRDNLVRLRSPKFLLNFTNPYQLEGHRQTITLPTPETTKTGSSGRNPAVQQRDPSVQYKKPPKK